MSFESILSAVSRRRWLFLGTLVLCVGVVIAATLALPKTYKASATLFVGQRLGADQALLDPNVGEQLTRTYTTLAADPNLAEEVGRALPDGLSRQEIVSRMTFVPVERTQLLIVTASGPSPVAAQRLANVYADTLVARTAKKFTQGGAPTRIAVSERAAVPDQAAAPNPPLYIGFGVILSLLLALATALIRERTSDPIVTSARDGTVLGRPLLAGIPFLDDHATIIDQDSFRLLRANIDFLEQGARVIAVTSGAPLEGKSTIAAHLAATAAADGERVVVIEADLRRPGLRNTILADDSDPSERGLTTVLMGATDAVSVINENERYPGLDVLWLGPAVPNPTALLRGSRFAELLTELRGRYDRVIVDTSPIAIGADASLIGSRVDGVIFVVDETRTRAAAATRALDQLDKAQAQILGVVVNRVKGAHSGAYGYYAQSPDNQGGRRIRRRTRAAERA